MTAVGRRPTLAEIISILDACTVTLLGADNPTADEFYFVLTLKRSKLAAEVPDWVEGMPKPTWLFEEIKAYLVNYRVQRAREEQWVSKEIDLLSINNVMSYWADSLKKLQAKPGPESILDRVEKKIVANTIVRLQELKERREAGGVHAQWEERREKARKWWAEDEYEAPKREEAQRQQREQANPYTANPHADWGRMEDILRAWRTRRTTSYGFGGNFGQGFHHQQYRQEQVHRAKSGNKRPWYEILGVSVDANRDEIRKAYRKLASKYQPRTSEDAQDKTRTEKMAEINAARDEGLGGL